jgi:ABC-type transport system involved in cytochrome bd biosynthesis fused ATPase/permease subunit
LLLVSGWLIVLAAVVMLAALAQRSAFMVAGLGVEILGLSLLAQAYKSQQRGAK